MAQEQVICEASTSGVTTETTETTQDFDFRTVIRELKDRLRDQEQRERDFRKEMTESLTLLERELVTMRKRLAKRPKRQSTGERKAGINKLTRISKDLAKFLGLEADAEVERGFVTKKIREHIVANKLNKEDGRWWTPDKKLQKILSPLQDKDKEKGYGYLNLQTYIKHNFVKA